MQAKQKLLTKQKRQTGKAAAVCVELATDLTLCHCSDFATAADVALAVAVAVLDTILGKVFA